MTRKQTKRKSPRRPRLCDVVLDPSGEVAERAISHSMARGFCKQFNLDNGNNGGLSARAVTTPEIKTFDVVMSGGTVHRYYKKSDAMFLIRHFTKAVKTQMFHLRTTRWARVDESE